MLGAGSRVAQALPDTDLSGAMHAALSQVRLILLLQTAANTNGFPGHVQLLLA
jgi:hypothetical protein